MKKHYLFLATLFVAAAVSVAVVSCKKDDPKTMLVGTNQSTKVFAPPQIEDMNAYLKDFKQKMKDSKGDETMRIDEAAWHLACLGNMDFCNVNVKYDDFLFDTVAMQVDVEDGSMLLNDIYSAYEQMCTQIQQFKNGFDHCDQNLYYINVSIDTDGHTKIATMTSFTYGTKYLTDHPWYFSDPLTAEIECEEYYSDDSTYYWDRLAASELKRVLNLFDHHENGIAPGGSLVICYTPTRQHTFDYTNTYDPYSSGYYYINESRVFAKRYTDPYPNYVFQLMEMCYCLDSYLGLGYDYIDDNLYPDEHPVNWTIYCISEHTPFSPWYYYYHQLYVEYGKLIPVNPTPSD